MKLKRYIAAGLLVLPMLAGCNKDLLNLAPKDELTVGTTFTKYENVRTYAWQFYDAFPAYNEAVPNTEFNGDLFLNANANGESQWIWQRMTIPSAATDYEMPYRRIRAINIMLDNLDKSEMTQEEKDHWRGVGYFFRAFNFYALVLKYGDVTWVEKAITETDTEVLLAKRTPRAEVVNKLLEQLTWAESHIKPAGDGANTITPHVVRAFIVRLGLQEGTWRKYHNAGDPQPFLKAAVTAGDKLIAAFPALHPNYDDEFNSESLATVPGILLYKQYELNQVTHVLASRGRNSAGRWDLTRKAADMYLCTDGETRWTSPLFAGDKSPYTEFRNRDRRLYFTVPPPFKVNVNHPSPNFTLTGNPADQEYIDLMKNLSTDKQKTLPTLNWQGLVVKEEPHFVDYNQGQPFNVTYTGYRFYKFSNKIARIQNQDINDAPIFRMAEVLVSYAEAKAELGEFDQSVADKTINKLRSRGGVAPLTVNAIPNDPSRDPAVAPVLWEIRRERAVELMGEGFRFDDLRRWKKMDYALARKLGRWIKKGGIVPANSTIPIEGGATEGYIAYEGVPPQAWPEYYYLFPVPSDQTVLNPNLGQNPGWK